MGRKAFEPAETVTFAVVGHSSSGKTSLAELLLQTTGVTRRVGRVDDGTSLLDHTPDERRRQRTLETGFAWLEYRDKLLNLLDVPGTGAFRHRADLALSVADAFVAVVGAPDGVERGTERALHQASVPGLAVVTKIDRRPDLDQALAELESATKARVLPLQLPCFEGGEIVGLVDLRAGELLRYAADGSGQFTREPVPERLASEVEEARERVVEAVALTNDDLLEQYLEFLQLSDDDVRAGLAAAVRSGRILPVLFASADRAVGAVPILDAIIELLPPASESVMPAVVDGTASPTEIDQRDFVAQLVATRHDEQGELYHVLRIWSGTPPRSGTWVHGETGATCKVRKLWQVRGPRRARANSFGPGAVLATWDPIDGRPGDTFTDGARVSVVVPRLPPPMMWYLLVPATDADERRLPAALEMLNRLDRAVEVTRDPLTGGFVLGAADVSHLDGMVRLLRDRLGVFVRTDLVPVPYREAPVGTARGHEGVYEKVTDGLVSAFGRVVVDLAPAPIDEAARLKCTIAEDRLPSRFLGGVRRGLREALEHGPFAGYPVAGVEIHAVDGDYDIIVSDDDHLAIATGRAVRAALLAAGTQLLEPWSEVDLRAHPDHVGTILSELSVRRGRVTGLEVHGAEARILALCPFREVRTLAPRLRTLTAGTGRFEARPAHYEVLPAHLVQSALQESPFRNHGPRPDPGTPKGAPPRRPPGPAQTEQNQRGTPTGARRRAPLAR